MRAGGGAQSPTREKRKKEKRTSVDLVSFQTQKTGSRLPSPVWSVRMNSICGDYVVCNASGWLGAEGPKLSDPANGLKFFERRGWMDDGP